MSNDTHGYFLFLSSSSSSLSSPHLPATLSTSPPPTLSPCSMHPLVILFLLLAFTLWVGWLLRAVRRFLKFWEIRTFYIEALNIPSSQLRNCTWADVLARLKEAQREYKMNIQKQELTELDVYHRILRFTNYMVSMVNKTVLPCKFNVPFYGEKVFFTAGLKFNYELILFCKFVLCASPSPRSASRI